MGIRFNCPSGHKLNVKNFLAGKRGVCPQCGAKFIIPMPADSPAAEDPQPVGIGQSQSIEIAVAPAPSQVVTAAAPPSAIISVVEPDPLPLELEPVAIVAPEIPPTIFPTAGNAVVPPLAVVEPVSVAPEPAYVSQRERSRRNQVIISMILLVLVVVLATVLFWVLWREHGQAPAGKSAVSNRDAHSQVLAAAVSGGIANLPTSFKVPKQ